MTHPAALHTIAPSVPSDDAPKTELRALSGDAPAVAPRAPKREDSEEGPEPNRQSGFFSKPEAVVEAETRKVVQNEGPLDTFQAYMRSAGKVPLLTGEREIELAREMEAGREMILAGVLRSPVSLPVFSALLRQLEEDPSSIRQLVRPSVDEETAELVERRCAELLRRAAECAALAAACESEPSPALVADLAEHLSPSAVEDFARPTKEANIEKSSATERLKAALEAIRKGEARVEKARSVLTQSNLRLVAAVAKRYFRAGMDPLDIIQEGNIGLMRAVERFDYRRGFRFSTYGVWWIRQAITRALANQSRLVRLPVHLTQLGQKLRRLQRKMSQEMGRDVTLEELAEASGRPLDQVCAALVEMRTSSLHEPRDGEDGPTLGETIADEDQMHPVEAFGSTLLHDTLLSALKILSPREASVICMRFGLGDCAEEVTLEEIGRVLNVTRERVRQIEAKALRQLRRTRYSGILRSLAASPVPLS